MMTMTFQAQTTEDTQKMAQALAGGINPDDIILLDGDLGAGKTTFSQFFAKALGVDQVVNSPTFSIVNEYQTNHGMLFHFDLYRIEESEELFDIGFDEYFSQNGIILIEWANKFPALIPEPSLSITIRRISEQERLFVFAGQLLPRFAEIIKEAGGE